MRNFKKLSCLLLALCMTATVMAGCGSKTTTDPADTSSSADYSKGLDENGFFEGVDALEYVELCDYDAIKVPADQSKATESEIESNIRSILDKHTERKQITDREVKDGDTLNIDYVGSVDGVEFAGGSTNGAGTTVTIGVTQYIDDFLEQLIGHKPGESFDIEVTFPKDYGQPDLQGKDAVFAITINYIEEVNTPSLTDKFVKKNFGKTQNWNTVDELKSGLSSIIEERKKGAFLSNYVVENSKVSSIPEEIIEFQTNMMINFYKGYAAANKVSFEEFLTSFVGSDDVNKLIEKNKDTIESEAKRLLIIQAVAQDAEISVSEDMIKEYFLKNFGSEDYSEFEDQYGLPYIKSTVIMDAVTLHLIDKSVVGE